MKIKHMKINLDPILRSFVYVTLITAGLLVTGCRSTGDSSHAAAAPAPTASASTTVSLAAPTLHADNGAEAAKPAVTGTVRIKAGASAPFKDSHGDTWLADQGFSGGDVIERLDVTVTNTTEPGIYLSEHYGMDSFSWPLSDGKYLVKLHFCETYDGIEGPGQRVFTFNIQGHEFKGFDVWVKAGGPFKAYVVSVPVEITGGKLVIQFTNDVENPQINGIEIIPQS
jgi:hypothetical protein